MRAVDLRSDTVTLPTEEMRRAMAAAELGDDVYGEDPTVNRLQELAADRLGKEAALFVPSGTMANQVAILCHTERGDEVYAEAEAHCYYYEAGAPAVLSGATVWPIQGRRGKFTPADLEAAIRPPNDHFPRPRLCCLENTHNRGGGSVWTVAETDAVARAAHARGLAVHLDGARIFNAAVALDLPAARLCREADSVMFCVSKGLGAPVGSLLCGSRELIARARRYRKVLGGGMRQAGVLAAAGIVALETMVDRLAEDHANARRLAEGLSAIAGFEVAGDVETNMVVVRVARDAYGLVSELAGRGLLCNATGSHGLRLVTHKDVGPGDIDRALGLLASA